MEKVFTKKTIIFGIMILIYIIALPLILYFSGAFKQSELPDLKRLNMSFDAQHVVKTDEEKRGILSDIGFNLQAFEDGGFAIQIKNIQVSVFENEPERLYSLSMEITDYETYYIKLTVYAPEADAQINRVLLRYERREINGNHRTKLLLIIYDNNSSIEQFNDLDNASNTSPFAFFKLFSGAHIS